MIENNWRPLAMSAIKAAADEVEITIDEYMFEAAMVAVVDRLQPKPGNITIVALGCAVLRQAAMDCKSKQYRIRIAAFRWINTSAAEQWCELCSVSHEVFAAEAERRFKAAEQLTSTM